VVKFEGGNEAGGITSDPIDIYGQSGGKFFAYTRTYDVQVLDRVLNIGFSPTIQNAQICGIEIRSLI
jgi:hypothetical protein